MGGNGGQKQIATGQEDQLPQLGGVHPVLEVAIEGLDRIGELEVGQRQYRFVDDDQQHFCVFDGLTRSVGDHDVDRRVAAWFECVGRGSCDDLERPGRRWNAQQHLAGRERRTIGCAVEFLAVVVEPRRGAGELDANVETGNVVVLDRDRQHRRVFLDREASFLDDRVALNQQQPLGSAERRLHENLGGVAGFVVLLVRNQLRFLTLDLGARTTSAATDPAGQLGAVSAAVLIRDNTADPVAATDLSVEGTVHRLGARRLSARLAFGHNFDPFAFDSLPDQELSDNIEVDAQNWGTVDIGHDCRHVERFAAAHERLVAGEADIVLARMHEQACRR